MDDDKKIRDNYNLFVLSNLKQYRDNYLNMMEKNIEYIEDIDSEISFGVELEVNHKDIDYFKKMDYIFSNFKVAEESSIISGLEIVSPIIHYTKDDMILLASVCDMLCKCGFYTDRDCGGHIHIGINYFKNIDDILMFLYIYSNCEDIIYLILNKSGSRFRRNINLYADKIKKNIELAIDMGDFDNVNNLSDLLKVFRRIFPNRYYGINLMRGHSTIEFRVPNGEICYEELRANIRFILKLVQRSREFSQINNNNKIKVMIDNLKKSINLEEKLEILLDLLFDNEDEKDIYRERYYKNSNLIGRFMMNINNCYFDKGVDFKKRKKVKDR